MFEQRKNEDGVELSAEDNYLKQLSELVGKARAGMDPETHRAIADQYSELVSQRDQDGLVLSDDQKTSEKQLQDDLMSTFGELAK